MIKEDAVVRDSNGKICIVSGVNKHGITVEYNNGGHCEDSDFLEHGSYEVIEDIRSMYEQQKQRADELEKQNNILKHNIRVELDSSRNMYIGMCEQKLRADHLEKRWSELRGYLKEFHQEAIIEVSKCKDEGDKGIVYACEKILAKISDFEEDGE